MTLKDINEILAFACISGELGFSTAKANKDWTFSFWAAFPSNTDRLAEKAAGMCEHFRRLGAVGIKSTAEDKTNEIFISGRFSKSKLANVKRYAYTVLADVDSGGHAVVEIPDCVKTRGICFFTNKKDAKNYAYNSMRKRFGDRLVDNVSVSVELAERLDWARTAWAV